MVAKAKRCLAQLKTVIALQNAHDQRNLEERVALADAALAGSDDKIIVADAVFYTHVLYTTLEIFFQVSFKFDFHFTFASLLTVPVQET